MRRLVHIVKWIFLKQESFANPVLQFLFAFFLFCFTLDAYSQAQVYPVSVTTQLVPPYSVNLADYAAPGSDQLRVIIVQRDLTQAPYRLYLKMEIQLNGRTIIRTSPEYLPPALTLDPGIPTVISGSDLTPFFDPANMEFTGYSRESYLRTKLLPEGAYMITFTAFDFVRRDVALSHGGAFFCYLAKSEPPLLNLPVNNSSVPFTAPQYINFQWLPRTTSSPNSALSTKYVLELFEIRVGGMSPNEVVNSGRPVFITETDQTTLLYSIAEPLLEKGMRYVWRIRAIDSQGRDYIRNDGYSEVFSFIYGEEGYIVDDNLIENFVATAVSPRKAKLFWDISSSYDSYKIFYRKNGSNNRWYESETTVGSAELPGLTPGEIYECRVQGKAGNIWGSLSETDTVLMPEPPLIECGSPFMPLKTGNRNPLSELMRLQELDAGGFFVTVTDPYAVTTRPGIFSGKGFVQVPLFGHKKIRCVFNDVFINTDFQMVEGVVRLLSDNTPGGDNALWDIDEVFEGGTDNGSVVQGTEETAVIISDAVITKPESIILDTAKQEMIVITDLQDTIRISVEEKLKDNPATLTVGDSEGNLYSVETGTGKSTYLGKAAPGSSARQSTSIPQIIDNRKGIVRFENADNARYAFDKKESQYQKSNLFTEEYRTIKLYDGSDYDVPFKLIPVGETDKVIANVEKIGKSVNPDSIVFRSGTGTIFRAEPTNKKSQYVLNLPSGKDNDGLDIYATYTDSKRQEFVLGKMIVISYQVKRTRLILVPVNGNGVDINANSIKSELDNIYHQVAVDWQVSIDDDFSAKVDSLDIKGSGLFSKYTDGMKKLNSEFILHKKETFDPSAIYLFMLQVSDDPAATGDMPRSQQFGYIFTRTASEGGKEALYRTLAHEIAHGMFHLSHTFDNQYQIPKGTTDNLLDYTAGIHLVKHQWDAIHDPGLVLGMFERDEDAAMKIKCITSKPNIPGTSEGQLQTVKGSMAFTDGYGGAVVDCEERFYYHIEEKPYNSCCDENGKEIIVQSEFKSDWYTEEVYATKVVKPILESFGILNGDVNISISNNELRKISAIYNVEQFFSERPVSDDLLGLFVTTYYARICNDASKRFSGTGAIDKVNVELDIVLLLSPIKGINSLVNYFKNNIYAKTIRLFAVKSENGISILAREGGEEIANVTDGVLKNIKYINEGGEVIATTQKLKFLEEGKEVESVFDIIRKEGQIGLRKSNLIINDISKLTTRIVKGPKTQMMLAKDVNKAMPFQNPFKPGTIVEEFELYENAVFIRVFDGVKSAKDGSWIMSIEDFNKAELSASRLENSFALPQKPLRYAKVTVPKGTKIRCGVTNSQNFNGKFLEGGSIQYQILSNYKINPGFNFEEIGLLK